MNLTGIETALLFGILIFKYGIPAVAVLYGLAFVFRKTL